MKKTVIKGIAFVVIFVISLVVISMVANQGNGDMTAPMPAASLPTMAIVEDGQEINQMYGYTMQMDTADMRESITPIKTARTFRRHSPFAGAVAPARLLFLSSKS